jgi:hypothetical protein
MTAPFDARKGSGDPETDPAAMGEVSATELDADGGAVVEDSAEAQAEASPS